MSEVTELQTGKSTWLDGPWKSEPDRVQWQHAGYACLILRGPLGQLCGYVGIDCSHPFYGKPYDDCEVEVHGGLTYADQCNGHVCHLPEPGMPADVWWLGFDCAHWMDLTPRLCAQELQMPSMREYAERHLAEDTYRDLPYVKAETERLAEQLRAKAQDEVGAGEETSVSSPA